MTNEAKAVEKYMRISPQKLRSVANEIRGKELKNALAILKFSPKKASFLLEKAVKSAASNAENNSNLNKDSLYISKIYVGEGPTLKRSKPRAMGRTDLVLKRTSHVTVVVAEKEV